MTTFEKKTLAATDSFVYMVQNLSFGRDIYSAVCSSPNGQKCQTIPQTQVTYTWGTLLAIKIMELGLGVLSYLVAPVKNSHLSYKRITYLIKKPWKVVIEFWNENGKTLEPWKSPCVFCWKCCFFTYVVTDTHDHATPKVIPDSNSRILGLSNEVKITF